MFKKLFKDKPIGFYFSLAASLVSLFLTIFYAAYMGAHDMFNGGVFVLYLFAFLLPLVYFFVKENNLTRIIPILQTAFLVLAFGILVVTIGALIVYFLTGSLSLASTSASGEALLAVFIITLVAILIAFVASFMKQTKQLTAEQQAEVDESWTNFKTNTKAFAVKHKKPLIISGAGAIALIVFIILLCTLIIPAALYVHVEGVTFGEDSSIVMYETETRALKVAFTPEEPENTNVTFESSDRNIVDVSSSGHLTAVGVGKATITVTTEDRGHTAKCEVEVKELTVTETLIEQMPYTVHYVKGEEFSESGLKLRATLTNGKTVSLNPNKNNFKYYVGDGEDEKEITTVDAKEVPVTVKYDYRGKTFEEEFTVYGDVAEVNSVTAFEEAYDKPDEYGYLRVTTEDQTLEFDALTFDRDIIVEGVLSADSVTLSNGADVEIVGRINDFTEGGQGDLFTVTGSGTLDIQTEYGNEKDDNNNGPLEPCIAGLYATNGLTVSGVTLTTTGIRAENGNMTVNVGANVTVLGPGYIQAETYNGIDVRGGTITVDGNETSLSVLNAYKAHSTRAAVECNGILVDNGATFVIGGDEEAGGNLYYYGVYSGGNATMTVRNGSTAKIETYCVGTNSQALTGISTLNVLDNSTFDLTAASLFDRNVSGEFDKDANITVNGTKLDMTKPLSELKFDTLGVTSYSVSLDPSVTYTDGDKFTGEGVTVTVSFGDKINAKLEAGFTAVETELVAGYNTVEVKIGDETKQLEIFADFADENKTTASDVEGFNSALANDSIKYITVSSELTFDELTINRDVYVEGNIKVGKLTVNDGVALNVIGRVWSDSDMTITGGGTVNAKEYAPESGTLPRDEFAAIRTNGKLTINGATVVNVSNIATGNGLDISGGAKVTVYGKNASGGGQGVNGIHSSGQAITVSGAGTELNVLYDDAVNSYFPAAIEAGSLNVDGAKVNIDSLTGASWSFVVWFEGGDKTLTVTNGAQVTADIVPGSNGQIFGNCEGIYATEGTSASGEKTSMTIVAPQSYWRQDIVKQGAELITWQNR